MNVWRDRPAKSKPEDPLEGRFADEGLVDAVVERLVGGELRPDDVLVSALPMPRSIDRYRIIDELGRGGMSVVYRASDPSGRPVAVKLVIDAPWSDVVAERARREARALALLDHRNIVRLLDFGDSPDGPFLVMELVDGVTLGQALSDGLRPEHALIALSDIAAALAFVHAQGIAHRDVKPSNILLRADSGIAQLADFGLVLDPAITRLTRSGGVVGTLAYMAPEQAEAVASTSSDVYSLGATLFEVVAGRPPLGYGKPREMILRIASERPEPVATYAPEVDPALGALIDACLVRDPTRRPSSAELARRLRAALGLDERASGDGATRGAARAPAPPPARSAPAPAPAPPERTGRAHAVKLTPGSRRARPARGPADAVACLGCGAAVEPVTGRLPRSCPACGASLDGSTSAGRSGGRRS